MPPTKSLASKYSIDHPFSFSDHTTVILEDSARREESVSPSDESSGLLNHGCSSKHSSAPPTTHTFSLPAGADNIPLMMVQLHSWAPSSTNTPAFVEGQCISGQVQLNLRTPDRIQAVLISVEGYYSIPGHEANTFLQVSETLWDTAMGDPRSSSAFLSQDADRSDKLHGKYSWSFKIEYPKAAEISGKEGKRIGNIARYGEKLPPSLRGSLDKARIGYEMVVRIKRPGFRFGSSLTIPVTYMIATRPYPGSRLRQLAYQNRTPVPSLFDDPTGWKVFPEFQANGSFHRTYTSFTSAFALATPLSYARGSFIPCILVLSSSNQRLLEAISSPSAPQVLLRRRLVLHSNLGGELVLDGQEKIVGKARWMTTLEPTKTSPSSRKLLQGEISIPPTAMPSFTFGILGMKYDVLVAAFDVPGFTGSESGPILRVDVEIASFHANGPLPLSQVT